MSLHNLISVKGRHKRKKLLGRGVGSGHGKTSTRGHKGQKSRAGRDFYPGFEGGQSPLIRRIPKRGFHHKPEFYQIVNIKSLENFKDKPEIYPKDLKEKGLIENQSWPVKILGGGEITKPFIVKAHKFSESALKKIEQAGGKAEVIEVTKRNSELTA